MTESPDVANLNDAALPSGAADGPSQDEASDDEPDVTVCVPVFNGAAFVGETLESLRQQTYRRFKVLISVDRSDDVSLAVCRAWAAYDAFEVFEQPTRLGWVRNVNWLLGRVATPFACIVPHDDLIAPDYLERLVDRLHRQPEAVMAYGDLHGFGGRDLILVEPSLTGTLYERMLDFLLNRTAAVQWRGLFRTEAMRQTRLHRPERDGYAADLLWLLELAARGSLVREPDVIYHKRYRSRSVSVDWQARPAEQAAVDWIEHCVACLELVLRLQVWTDAERQQFAAATLARAIHFVNAPSHPAPSPPDLGSMFARLAHVMLRVSRNLPSGASLPDEDALPAALATRLERAFGRLAPPEAGRQSSATADEP